jgi:hypothetical protein
MVNTLGADSPVMPRGRQCAFKGRYRWDVFASRMTRCSRISLKTGFQSEGVSTIVRNAEMITLSRVELGWKERLGR